MVKEENNKKHFEAQKAESMAYFMVWNLNDVS